MVDDGHRRLRAHLVRRGLKASRQRDIIADVFFAAGGHLSVDDLLKRARAVDPRVSQATVYRTMKLLADCGLAETRHFFDAETLYERGDPGGAHHDHLICTACGAIVEFVDARIEALQEAVARRHGFVVEHHKMELYGLCPPCHRALGAGAGGARTARATPRPRPRAAERKESDVAVPPRRPAAPRGPRRR